MGNMTMINLPNLLDIFYPVGTIYETADSSFTPATKWGGTWVKVEGRMLLGSSSSYAVGSTGGEATHTLTIDEIPAHNHSFNYYSYVVNGGGQANGLPFNITDTTYIGRNTAGMQNTGGGQAHNNMPPYYTVNIWRRTA